MGQKRQPLQVRNGPLSLVLREAVVGILALSATTAVGTVSLVSNFTTREAVEDAVAHVSVVGALACTGEDGNDMVLIVSWKMREISVRRARLADALWHPWWSNARLTLVQERRATVDTSPVAGLGRDRHGSREESDDADDLHFA